MKRFASSQVVSTAHRRNPEISRPARSEEPQSSLYHHQHCPWGRSRHQETRGDNKSSAPPGTTYTRSNANREYGHSPGTQCLIVTKTEGHGLLELNLLHLPIHFSVNIRSHVSGVFFPVKKREQRVSPPPAHCIMAYCGLFHIRQRMKVFLLLHLVPRVFLLLGIRVPSVLSYYRCGSVCVRAIP